MLKSGLKRKCFTSTINQRAVSIYKGNTSARRKVFLNSKWLHQSAQLQRKSNQIRDQSFMLMYGLSLSPNLDLNLKPVSDFKLSSQRHFHSTVESCHAKIGLISDHYPGSGNYRYCRFLRHVIPILPIADLTNLNN